MNKEQNRNDDNACGKLWEIYVKEAQQYDEGMIRSWKEDMDSMLVFSGLYSAILTAFVIESYQNLQRDPAEYSSAILRRISEQLASSSTLPPIPDPSSFTPTDAALACNILWFISLCLALTCAFLATLVQQWSRRFLHRTSTVRSPGAHAHLLQFLYFGLKDSRMHAVVDLIPSLLHLSLFSFFAGLIAFLHDGNGTLTWISAAALSLVLLTYLVLTVFPLFKLDSPYATPLSSLCWRLLQTWRHIRALAPPPSISSLIRQLRSISPLTSHTHISDHEAQRGPSNPVSTVKNQDDVHSHCSAVEWSISDATVKASRLRHVEREAKSIVWLLRSLNDDSELLPFVEALPDALQIKEDDESFRENNFHLLEALVASTDPQVNIILRILDLMDNARSPWHTSGHKERCAAACAKALYALGHIVHANPGRFRPITHNTPLFTIEILNRIGKGFCGNAIDMAYGQSALLLCALSSSLWFRDRLAMTMDNSSEFSSIIRQVLTIGKIDWGYKYWDNIVQEHARLYEVSNSIPLTPTQSQAVIDDVISHLFFQYTLQGITDYPQHFVHLSELIIGCNTKRLRGRFEYDKVLLRLVQTLNMCSFEDNDRYKVEAIFGVVIHVLGDEHISGHGEVSLLEFLSLYHRTFGWGHWGGLSLSSIHDIIPKVLQRLQYRDKYPQPFEEHYLTSLKHLLSCTRNNGGYIYLFWAKIYKDIRRTSLRKSPQELSLAYLIALAAAESSWSIPESEHLRSLLDQIYENISVGKIYYGARRHHLHWIALLQCLGSGLPISHTSDVLKFFHYLVLFPLPVLGPNNNVAFLESLTRYSEGYSSSLVHDWKSDSDHLLEVNGMIWAIWAVLASDLGNVETLQECRAWDGVSSLLRTLDEALTPEICQASRALVVQPRSSKNPSSAILHPDHNSGRDLRSCLDLPANIEATKKQFVCYMHLFTHLPDADAEEDRLLNMDDDTYSNRIPIHRDRLEMHYFLRLPPSDEEEDAALQPPPGDPTYNHTQPSTESYDQGSDACQTRTYLDRCVPDHA